MSFFYFPKDKTMREVWQKTLKMGKKITDSDRVCKEHFRQSDFFPRANASVRISLKKNVVPSQKIPLRSFDNVESSPQKRKREGRNWRRNRRAQVKQLKQQEEQDRSPDIETDSDNNSDDDAEFSDDVRSQPDCPENDTARMKSFRDNCIQTRKFSLFDLLRNDAMLYTFSGLPNFHVLEIITECALKLVPETMRYIIPMKLRVLLTFTKLKLNLSYTALSVLFDISWKTCSNYFRDTVQILALVLKGLIYLPSKEETLANMPKCFRKFSKTRVVLESAETAVDHPKCLKERIMLYSHYKGRLTVKFLVGVTPAGLLCLLSTCFGGRASDKKITIASGILDKLDFNDGVMVDKGFLIQAECLERHLIMYRPPFISKKKTLTKAEAIRTAEIARARVHVERVIKNLRDFSVLSEKISCDLLPYFNDILLVCGAIVNLSPPILAMDKF